MSNDAFGKAMRLREVDVHICLLERDTVSNDVSNKVYYTSWWINKYMPSVVYYLMHQVTSLFPSIKAICHIQMTIEYFQRQYDRHAGQHRYLFLGLYLQLRYIFILWFVLGIWYTCVCVHLGAQEPNDCFAVNVNHSEYGMSACIHHFFINFLPQ